MKSLFKNPFVLTIQGQEFLDLRGFEYGAHDALIIDNLVTWDLVLKHRAMWQSNADLHLLGQSSTGMYSYQVFLWAVPVCITLDSDVDCSPFYNSEWLQANVFLDDLPNGAKCYIEGQRPRIPMSAVGKLGN